MKSIEQIVQEMETLPRLSKENIERYNIAVVALNGCRMCAYCNTTYGLYCSKGNDCYEVCGDDFKFAE